LDGVYGGGSCGGAATYVTRVLFAISSTTSTSGLLSIMVLASLSLDDVLSHYITSSTPAGRHLPAAGPLGTTDEMATVSAPLLLPVVPISADKQAGRQPGRAFAFRHTPHNFRKTEIAYHESIFLACSDSCIFVTDFIYCSWVFGHQKTPWKCFGFRK
jgi:hypothetical protein